MKNRKVYVTTFCGVCVAMNIVLGIITSALGIPLYLDTLGTVLSAAILGPIPGVIVGALSNIITGLMYSVSDIPFCLVNMAVGLIVGLVAKKMGIWSRSGNYYRCGAEFHLSGNRNTDWYLCIRRIERIGIGRTGYVSGTGRKNYFPGIVPAKCSIQLG